MLLKYGVTSVPSVYVANNSDYRIVGLVYVARLIANANAKSQPQFVPLHAANMTFDEAKDAVLDGTKPAAGVSGDKGERKGESGQAEADFDKVNGIEKNVSKRNESEDVD